MKEISYLCTIKQLRIMTKEEVTTIEKFSKWKVYRRKGKKVTESVETSPRKMKPSEAVKHFKASAILGLKD